MTLFSDLVAVSQRVAATNARKAKIGELAALLRGVASDEIATAVHFLSGEIVQGRIGIGYSTLKAAAGQATAALATLSIAAVDDALATLAVTSGAGSAARRQALLSALFSRATASERDFLLRLLSGELRQGALQGVMVDAIATAAQLPVAAVRRAAMYSKSLGAVATAALQLGVAGLCAFELKLFTPVAPMLAQTAVDVTEALQKLAGEAAFEWKMDGARIQVHKVAQDVRIYTRGLNEVTAAVPEIVESVKAWRQHGCVLDGEAIVFDESGRPQPFQITMRRFGRKSNVEALRLQLPIRAFFFDCLSVDGRSIVALSTADRHRVLTQIVPAEMQFPRLVTESQSAAAEFYAAALEAGHEGVMAKALDTPYEAGNRGASWLKIKRAHTLDLVVLAAEWGHGRRSGLLSNLHLGAIDPHTHEYVMLGKTFKGLTDAMLKRQTEQFLACETRRTAGTVFVRPEIVVEVAFSDLQSSIRYPGGLALRLARVKRYRDDKSVEQADTMDTVRKLYDAQAGGAA